MDDSEKCDSLTHSVTYLPQLKSVIAIGVKIIIILICPLISFIKISVKQLYSHRLVVFRVVVSLQLHSEALTVCLPVRAGQSLQAAQHVRDQVEGRRHGGVSDESHPDLNSTVQYSIVKCSKVRYSTPKYSTVHQSTVQYSKVQYSTSKYSTVHSKGQHSIAQYSTS